MMESRFDISLPDPPETKFSMENWLPFTWAVVSRFLGPRKPTTAFSTPFDVSRGVDITRFGPYPSAARPFPYPYLIGAVGAGMPMQDNLSMQYAWAATPSGPGVATPTPVPFMQQYQDLMKRSG